MKNKNIFATISSDIGCVREKNQDNFYFNGNVLDDYNTRHIFNRVTCEDDAIFAVADGMGGESFGEFASFCTVDLLRDSVNSDMINSSDDIKSFVFKANQKICMKMEECQKKIGTTLALAKFKGNCVSFYNIGDSKCLLYRNGKVEQFSKDHTVVANLVRMNILTQEQAKTDKRRHQLSQHLGIFPEEFTISLYESEKIEIKPNDIVILCSDGLTDALDFEDIAKIIESTQYIDEISERLVKEAIENGSKDNVTVLIAYSGFNGIENLNFKAQNYNFNTLKAPRNISQNVNQYNNLDLYNIKSQSFNQNNSASSKKSFKEYLKNNGKQLLLWSIIYILSAVIGVVSGMLVSGFMSK